MCFKFSIMDYEKIENSQMLGLVRGQVGAKAQKLGQVNSIIALSWDQHQVKHKNILRTGL